MTRVLAVRLDSDGDVLLTGPAVRALAAGAEALDLLVSPAGRQAGELLPGVDRVLVADVPWSGYAPPPADPAALRDLVDVLAAGRYDRAVVFTSFHQSPLPMALLLRMAGVPFVAGTSEDYPGSLLDVRHRRPDGLHEVEAALDLARAVEGEVEGEVGAAPAGRRGSPALDPALDDDRLALRADRVAAAAAALPDEVPAGGFVVLHPGASVPARAPSPAHARTIALALAEEGRTVVVTGGPGERELARAVATGVPGAVDLAGRTSLAGLAAVLARADAVVVGNTGPAHLAAAVGTPVVSLFSPVVPADRWAPWGVPTVVLGDQGAPCALTRARTCPVEGHPCLTGVTPGQVVAAVDALSLSAAGAPARTTDHADASGARPDGRVSA
ncbi:glycosyltransferase family 9 protein [Cellulomonas marina]|uniref:ADP-heptose:LPS heptosyltransferase n=1 Tax=Cellulomonas marina TaxID=988821 RepID=A0A1I0V7H9_9CELL|nr:glycosyltransferase family 9 protein [Cellulomonas marina]GIG28373.1 glycosyl transferase [Cellulomonas marina]SFA72020.1 ADP-heptose:LPS heptosyltransferase [Cellulomonas marina]